VTNYNIKCTKHLGFVINGKTIWAHWCVLCLDTNVMLPMTQATFATMVQLLKVECKRKSFNPSYSIDMSFVDLVAFRYF
jgi:hypothetical protein